MQSRGYIRKSTGEFEGLALVHLPKDVAKERGIVKWLPVGACVRGHWLPRRTTSYECPACNFEWRKEDPKGHIVRSARSNAKRRGLEFDIEADDIHIPSVCPIFGTPINMSVGGGFGSGRGSRNNPESGPQLDRIDPSKGYIKGNVWVISGKANRMKQDMSLGDLKMFVSAIEKKMQELEP